MMFFRGNTPTIRFEKKKFKGRDLTEHFAFDTVGKYHGVIIEFHGRETRTKVLKMVEPRPMDFFDSPVRSKELKPCIYTQNLKDAKKLFT